MNQPSPVNLPWSRVDTYVSTTLHSWATWQPDVANIANTGWDRLVNAVFMQRSRRAVTAWDSFFDQWAFEACKNRARALLGIHGELA